MIWSTTLRARPVAHHCERVLQAVVLVQIKVHGGMCRVPEVHVAPAPLSHGPGCPLWRLLGAQRRDRLASIADADVDGCSVLPRCGGLDALALVHGAGGVRVVHVAPREQVHFVLQRQVLDLLEVGVDLAACKKV